MRGEVVKYAEKVGRNTLLVQGAGGNLSWKDGDVLWVKASGTWLANAVTNEIFVPIDLGLAREKIEKDDPDFSATMLSSSDLRPSIETAFHVLLPHRIVFHLHAVDVLVHVVKTGFSDFLKTRIGNSVRWTWTGYCRPGLELATVLSRSMQVAGDVDVIFLGNHGLIIGGASVHEIESTLSRLLAVLSIPPREIDAIAEGVSCPKALCALGYIAPADSDLQYLARDPICLDILSSKWALYPDHVVFLGPNPQVFAAPEELLNHCMKPSSYPDYALIPGNGLFMLESCGKSKTAMLRCYADLLRRLDGPEGLQTLSPTQVSELLGWDAEKYRIQNSH